MRLRDLQAQFIGNLAPDDSFETLDVPFHKAQGVMFLCPKCFHTQGGHIGTHSVICWFRGRGVPDATLPGPGRWNPSGTGLDDLTFVGPELTSVQLTGGCAWHGHIAQGEALGDGA